MNDDANNIDYEIFHETYNSWYTILNAHVPLKEKHLRVNYATFVTNEFRKAVMKRARLKNDYLKKIIRETFVLVF